jgi:RHS repeat-associated protein
VATRVSGGPNAGTYFVHGDHLGSLNVLTNSSGTEVQRLTYLPFGETYASTGTVAFDQRRFTGQEQDPETGLYFYQARYYNPVLGRFLSPDSIVPGAGNPQSLNRYSYVNNNPINRTDPSGHSWLSKFFRSFVRALPAIIMGVAVGLVTWGLGAAPVLAGILGGAAAGAVNTAVNGGNLGLNILAGAAFGGLAGWLGPPLYTALGEGFWGAVGSGAILGAAFGGIGAAIARQNVLAGMFGGALGGALVAAAVFGAYQVAQLRSSPALAGYETQEAAGGAALSEANPLSIRDNLEYYGLIYREESGTYGYTEPIAGGVRGGEIGQLRAPEGTTEVGMYHTHGDYSIGDELHGFTRTSDPSLDVFDSNNFSRADRIAITNRSVGRPGYLGYLGTPSGHFRVYNPATGATWDLR